MVGDAYGRIKDPDTGEDWIGNPETAVRNGNGYVQTRWIHDTDINGNKINLSRDQWASTPKTFNPDGTPIKEGYENNMTKPATIIIVAVLCIVAFGFIKK